LVQRALASWLWGGVDKYRHAAYRTPTPYSVQVYGDRTSEWSLDRV
jgi:hypothetical protein